MVELSRARYFPQVGLLVDNKIAIGLTVTRWSETCLKNPLDQIRGQNMNQLKPTSHKLLFLVLVLTLIVYRFKVCELMDSHEKCIISH